MSMDLSKLFGVHYSDFRTLWDIDDPMDWEPPFEVRKTGVFIPTPSEHMLRQLTPAELVRVTHPTGNPDDPVLSFPCSLEEMMRWGFENGLGDFSNTRLIDWMRTRVELNRGFAEWSTLDAIADQLFELEKEGAEGLLAYIEPGATHPTYPCSINTLLEWCQEAREKWCADESIKRPQVEPPSNESLVRLVTGRLPQKQPSLKIGTDRMRTHEQTSRVNIILALGVIRLSTGIERLGRSSIEPLKCSAIYKESP